MLLKRYLKLFVLVFLLYKTAGETYAQILTLPIDSTASGKPLIAFLRELESQHPVRFYFLNEWLAAYTLGSVKSGQTVQDILLATLGESDLTFVALYPNSITFVKNPEFARSRNSMLAAALAANRKISRKVMGDPSQRPSTVILSGVVVADKNQEPLPGVLVNISSELGVVTDRDGRYQIQLVPGVYAITFSHLDYQPHVIDLEVYSSGQLDIVLEKSARMLDEIVITDKSTLEVTTSGIGQIQLTMRDLKRAPALMGEADIIKQIQTLPGVTTVGEAAAGFNVRGGSVDQNLTLYDDMPVFNSSHAFGFLSSFNPEAVRDVSFYRGGIPAYYGGRNASVLDIRSRDGDFEKWSGSASLGLVTSQVMINGPVSSGKTSVAGSFRTTYSNWLVNSIRTDYIDLRNSSVRFYDGSLKVNHKFSDKSILSVTGYSSQDQFSLSPDTTYQWSNFLVTSRLNYQPSEKINAEFQAGIGQYSYRVFNNEPPTASRLTFKLNMVKLSSDFSYQHNGHSWQAGWQLFLYQLLPGTLQPESDQSNALNYQLDTQFTIENSLYISDAWRLTDHLHAEVGLRIPIFSAYGPEEVYQYQSGMPRELYTVTDTLHVKPGEVIKLYAALEPRISLRWQRSEKSSFKVGYHRINQFLHLITNSASVTPVDIWQPSGYYYKPQRADQFSAGYYRDMKERTYNFFVEGFYKYLSNILDFKDGAQLVLNPQLETALLQGRGYAYGIETSLSKNTGKLTGSLNYTYSRSWRIFSGPSEFESINQGARYPSNFDQPHIANVSWKYNLSRRHFFTGTFTYHTGRPITLPTATFAYEGNSVAYFSPRNQYRIPDYHRLDLALVMEGNHKRSQRLKGTWVISVYNVYARKNPYTIFYKSNGNGVPVPYQLSIIGTAFPAISYTLRFD